ncbi:MAG: uracil phosphoribosyltransferase [Verrucomicrobiota bacterium]
MPSHPGFTRVDHPLLARAIGHLRDTRTASPEFRRWLDDAASLLAWEVTRTLETRRVRVRSPLATTHSVELRREVVLVPILRAGVGMLEAFLRVVPDAGVGFVGQKRDEATLQPATYLANLPAATRTGEVIVLDPMLATGGSAAATLALLKQQGAKRIRLACLFAAPPGVQRIARDHPDVPVFAATLDPKLTAQGYIVPGLGDAGDRCFGT